MRQLTQGLPDIEAALLKIDEVASSQEGIAAEEQLILRGYSFHDVSSSSRVSDMGTDLNQTCLTRTKML
jgi:hypothetical protein